MCAVCVCILSNQACCVRVFVAEARVNTVAKQQRRGGADGAHARPPLRSQLAPLKSDSLNNISPVATVVREGAHRLDRAPSLCVCVCVALFVVVRLHYPRVRVSVTRSKHPHFGHRQPATHDQTSPAVSGDFVTEGSA